MAHLEGLLEGLREAISGRAAASWRVRVSGGRSDCSGIGGGCTRRPSSERRCALTVQTEMEPLGVLTISTHGRGPLVSGSVRVVSEGPIRRDAPL